MDVLLDRNVRGYVLGATNVLFKQKKNLADILVEVCIDSYIPIILNDLFKNIFQ